MTNLSEECSFVVYLLRRMRCGQIGNAELAALTPAEWRQVYERLPREDKLRERVVYYSKRCQAPFEAWIEEFDESNPRDPFADLALEKTLESVTNFEHAECGFRLCSKFKWDFFDLMEEYAGNIQECRRTLDKCASPSDRAERLVLKALPLAETFHQAFLLGHRSRSPEVMAAVKARMLEFETSFEDWNAVIDWEARWGIRYFEALEQRLERATCANHCQRVGVRAYRQFRWFQRCRLYGSRTLVIHNAREFVQRYQDLLLRIWDKAEALKLPAGQLRDLEWIRKAATE